MSILRPKKPSESHTNIPSRLRLPVESSFRDLKGIKELLATADEKRGCQVELPWESGHKNLKFILTVKWEKGAFNPIWTLYEETEHSSKTVWSQPFAPSDMDFMYDVLSMSAGAAAAPDSKIPDDLKPPPPEEVEAEEAKKAAAKTEKAPVPRTEKAEPEAKPAAKEAPQQAAPPQQHAPPFPQQQMPPQMGYPMPPGYVYAPVPMPPPGYGGPAYMPPGTPYPAPQPNWGYGAPPSGTTSGITPRIDPVSEGSSAPPAMNYLEKRPGILIGSLLTEAELITEPTLEAALKIQELVRQGRLTATRAPEILKMFFSMGPSIEDYIDPSDLKPIETKAAPSLQPRGAQPPNKDMSLALSMLIKAGILKENDVKMANQVRQKHGGDIKNILQAAGKFDSKTIDAALICIDMERRGVMKLEQCIIALNFCSRSRVGFDEALDELGWENPRKQKKI
jgi:hypothetical protein